MSNEIFVLKYFDPAPIQWGLRGDPHLWEDMKTQIANTPIPNSTAEFEQILHRLVQKLVGEPPQKGKNIYIKKYATGGMSSGMVSSDFWLERAFPLLIQRFINDKST